MPLPLTKTKKYKRADPSGNQGLYFNKFFDQWDNNFSKVTEPTRDCVGGKPVWLKTFSKNIPSAKSTVQNIQDIIATIGGEVREYATTGPFITGMGLSHPVENGFFMAPYSGRSVFARLFYQRHDPGVGGVLGGRQGQCQTYFWLER